MLLDQASALDDFTTAEDVWDHTTQALRQVGFSFFIYLVVDQSVSNPTILSNVASLYEGMDIARDPFLTHCCHSYSITLTGPDFLPDYDYLPSEAKAFIKRARETGFRTGLGIPMRLQGSELYGGFNIGTDLPRRQFEAEIVPMREECRAFCLLAHRRLEELARPAQQAATGPFGNAMIAPETPALTGLTPREREVAFLIAQGLSRKECARVCGISPNTVSDYVKVIYRKTGINDRLSLSLLIKTEGFAAQPLA